ncbi:MAG: DUF4115 domain-containing protein [Candidatus Thiodiazotropha sp. (ex Lucinoma aequizonata)]|nr:DUF4115 domain-containing protein [Candidatus Thiodiazotropha sp. (ex Lucinoma aequizonata)]
MSKDENHPSPEPVVGPGTQLRKARERLGLEQAKMAAQLHLSQSMIKALELDNYEMLPGPVFVQGYLRNYSRLLGVNEEAVIEAYQCLFPVSDELPAVSHQNGKVGKDLHSGHRVVRLVTWAILLLLPALLFFWWQTRVELEELLSAPPEDQSLQAPQDMPVDLSTPFSVPVEEAMAGSIPTQEMMEEKREPIDGEVKEAMEAIEPEISSVDERFKLPVETEPPEVVVEPPQPQVIPVEVVATPLSKLVVFKFDESCWAEVRGQDGKTRIFGEMQSGAKRSLNSQLGPFNVILGNAAAVRLTINGNPFDLKPFIRGKVARFTLDQDQL